MGSLLVSKKHGSGKRGVVWQCTCACGETVLATSGYLAYGVKKNHPLTCGCVKSSKRSKHAYLHAKYSSYRSGASKRGLRFSLTQEQCYYLFTQDCYWCGTCPVLPTHDKVYTLSIGVPVPTNGIDRYDNTLGYESTNCVPCCGNCNKVKWHLSGDEFLDLIKTYYLKHLL